MKKKPPLKVTALTSVVRKWLREHLFDGDILEVAITSDKITIRKAPEMKLSPNRTKKGRGKK